MKRLSKIISTAIIGGIFAASIALTSFANEWKQDENGWWYLMDDGSYLYSEWYEIDGQWYYFLDSGYMAVNGWAKSGDEWYYLGADGKYLVNTVTPDGYMLDVEGRMMQKASDKSKKSTAAYEEEEEEETKGTIDNSAYKQSLIDTYTTILNRAKRDLESAQYELSKAENQKTQKIYREGEGFVYEADEAAVRRAQNKVDSLEEKISNYENKISALQ